MKKAITPYRSGPLYLIKRGDFYHIHGTYNGDMIRVTANTDDLRRAKRALDDLLSDLESGWRQREKDLSSSWEFLARSLCDRHRHSAKARKLPFDITVADVYKLLKATDFRCAVSGIAFSRRISMAGEPDPWGPSIDRIENRHGYLKDNIRIVCLVANLAMNRWGYDTLLRLSRSMVSNSSFVQADHLTGLTHTAHSDFPEPPQVVELSKRTA